ncbi:ARM repeat-containing protein [Testicularia cyperi]|uniref:ARM repeat-containing protein n=1 Tax=Testicularia cyperi TaxID=1882483 RepID=A0A317XQJ9_9BASI|nr:ARM repeat-containing protein [Testicularia cyperi]
MGLGLCQPSGFNDIHLDLDNPDKAITQLKSVRNSVIGSRTKKSNLVHTGMIEQLVQLLRFDLGSSPHAAELVSLSATIIASLANTPAHATLLQLMRSGVQHALLSALRNLIDHVHRSKRHILEPRALPFDALKVLESLLRSLRSILLSIADQLCASPRWGIGSSWGAKPAASGVSLAGLSASAGATKLFGKSHRDSSTLPSPMSSSVSTLPDVLMSSASTDDLRTRARLQAEDQERQERRELRLLARTFLTSVYAPEHLSLLMGPLFMCPIPQQPDSAATSTLGTPSPALRPADSQCNENAMVESAVLSDREGAWTPSDVDSLSMTTKTKVLGIIEMVCTVLTGTVYIPGCSTDSTGLSAASPAEDLRRRRERVLTFTAANSPLSHLFERSETVSSALAEQESRGRRDSDLHSRRSSGIQAELIRKGSRSRSRINLKEPGQSGIALGGGSSLPLWQEDTDFSNVTGSNSLPSAEGLPDTTLVALLAAAECGYPKTQEAALFALAELTRDDADASMRLFGTTPPSGQLPTSMLLNLRRSTSPSVRLAAFCCLANIIKVHPFTPKTNQCVLEVLMELLDHTPAPGLASSATAASASASHLHTQSQVEIRIQAAFAIARLVSDNVILQTLAAESYHALFKLVTLLDKACSRSAAGASNKPERPAGAILLGGGAAIPSSVTDPTLGAAPQAVDESAIRLREACLTALASLTFQQDELRRKLLDTVQPSVLPMVVSSLTFPAMGVRVAACRLTRALSRSISILRTSIVDAGVAPKLVAMLKSADEEEAVKVEAAAAICNLVLEFSPMKKLVQDLGGIERLVQLAHYGDSGHGVDGERAPDDGDYTTLPVSQRSGSSAGRDSSTRHSGTGLSGSQQLRLHALWALKNMLSNAEHGLKAEVMSKLTFAFVVDLCRSGPMVFREQALNLLRNLGSSKDSDITFMVDGVGGGARLMSLLETCIWDGREGGEPGSAVIEQAAFVLVNVATGTEAHRRIIVRSPNILDALGYFCNHPWKNIRVAAARCMGNLLSRSKISGPAQPESDERRELAAPSSAEVGGGSINMPADFGSANEEPFNDAFSEAKARITVFGLANKLRDMADNDVELDVRERARSALNKYESAKCETS